MKKYMYQMNMNTIGEMKTLETHFACMAERGWMIDKIGLFAHRYRAIPPCKKQFFVDLLPQITMFDYPENDDAQDYRRLCEESGWSFVAANKQFHVFCTDENASPPVPIHTDNKIQAQIYLKACRKYEWFSYIYSLLILGYITSTQIISKGILFLLSDLSTFLMLGCFFFSIGNFLVIGFVISWYLRTRKSAKLDLPMPVVSYRLSRVRSRVFTLCAFAFLACLLTGIVLEFFVKDTPKIFLLPVLLTIAALAAGFWVRLQIDVKRRERDANIRMFLISIVALLGVSIAAIILITGRPVLIKAPELLEPPPVITLSDVGITSEPQYSILDINGSIAVPVHYNYLEMSRYANSDIEVYRSVSAALARRLYRRLVKEISESYGGILDFSNAATVLDPDGAAFWGADEGVTRVNSSSNTIELILTRDRVILRLLFSGDGLDIPAAAKAVNELWGG